MSGGGRPLRWSMWECVCSGSVYVFVKCIIMGWYVVFTLRWCVCHVCMHAQHVYDHGYLCMLMCTRKSLLEPSFCELQSMEQPAHWRSGLLCGCLSLSNLGANIYVHAHTCARKHTNLLEMCVFASHNGLFWPAIVRMYTYMYT